MTKLLKVNCAVYFDEYIPAPEEDYDAFIMEVDRYYTSEDIAEAFEFAESRKLERTFGHAYSFYFQREWVEVDNTEIPERMINTGFLHEIYCSMWYDAFNKLYIPNDWYIDDWPEW